MQTRVIVVVALVGLAGCATSGTGVGVLETTGKPGEASSASDAVLFTWHADADATHGTISAALPDGRVFDGRFVSEASATRVTQVGAPFSYNSPVVDGSRDGPYWVYAGSGSGVYRTFTGHVSAILHAAGGERMACDFELVEPVAGPAAGGTGSCRLSGGEQITQAVLSGD